MPVRAWIAAAACAVAGLGCGAPAALLLPPPSPPGEALAWFPERSVAVALVQTDLERPGVKRLLEWLNRKAPGVIDRAPSLEQLRPLLGNELAVGRVAPGEAPLGVLVTKDGFALDLLADAWVKAGRAASSGTYRGAELHAAGGHAFAVRGDVLLVSRTTADLRRALDRRVNEDGTDEDDLPDSDGELRALANPRALLARAPARLRAIPWLAAAQRIALTGRALEDAAELELAVDTGGDELVDLDVPITRNAHGPRMVDVPGSRLAVADLAHVLRVAERAAGSAAPLALLRTGAALPAVRALAASLDGPATLIRRRGRLLLRADPRSPGRTAGAYQRLIQRLENSAIRVRHANGFHEAFGWNFAIREGVLVAGTSPPRRLERLARAPLARPAGAKGSVAFSLPRRRLTGWASATPSETTIELRIRWP